MNHWSTKLAPKNLHVMFEKEENLRPGNEQTKHRSDLFNSDSTQFVFDLLLPQKLVTTTRTEKWKRKEQLERGTDGQETIDNMKKQPYKYLTKRDVKHKRDRYPLCVVVTYTRTYG